MNLHDAMNNMTHTENLMPSYKSTLDECVDLFFQVGASRGKCMKAPFKKALKQDKDIAMRILLWSRDVRGGAGERQIFRDLIRTTALTDRFVSLIPEVGRWDDVLALRGTPHEDAAVSLLRTTLLEEQNGLCAKWMPRKGEKAVWLRYRLGLSPKSYRKMLVNLTRVVESEMTANQWQSIDYEKVPSLASARYQKAFARHDPEGYEAYKQGLVTGTASVHADTLYPYDVLKSLYAGDSTVAQAQWEALPDFVENDSTFLPVIDVSGSMTTRIAPNLTALMVSVSLGLYLAEHNKGIFKDQFVTFSARPEMHKVHGTLEQRLEQIENANWGMNTDIEAVFDLILNAAQAHKVPQNEMPSVILILSDMQFDQATTGTPALAMIAHKYERAGYKRPEVVFWNLCDRPGNIPATLNDTGVGLVSGFSPSIVKTLLSGETMDPVKIMKAAVCIPRYDWQ
ncbi:MAG TPA: DUF2828 family protein [Thermotogota bacterium]|nr:DUF2828 family protein [Thermotogota bacterium]